MIQLANMAVNPRACGSRRNCSTLSRIFLPQLGYCHAAGKAARELGLGRLAFMDLLKRRGIPCFTYTTDDWEADAEAIAEFERRRKIG